MIVGKNQKPVETIFYTAGCILATLGNGSDIDSNFQDVKEKYSPNIEYKNYLLAVDFLYLLDKVSVERGVMIKC